MDLKNAAQKSSILIKLKTMCLANIKQQKQKYVGLQHTKKLQYRKKDNRVKRPPTKWEKIFINHTSD